MREGEGGDKKEGAMGVEQYESVKGGRGGGGEREEGEK